VVALKTSRTDGFNVSELFFKEKKPKKSEKEKTENVVKLERQFLPEQMPIQTTKKALPNLFRYMEKQVRHFIRPISVLHDTTTL
jgi:hypothetical protein